MISAANYILIGLASAVAGAANALAGGGTLITFPMLTAVGMPPVAANVTNTVAMCPGYLSAAWAQSRYLQGQRARAWLILPSAVAGGLIGSVLLLYTSERLFSVLVPYLILLATILLAVQDPVRIWLARRSLRDGAAALPEKWAALPIGLGAVYGGYFGGGLGIILLAVLSLMLQDTLTRISALKQAVAVAVNTAAALFFIFSGKVEWTAAAIMAVGSLAGGAAGGRLANWIKPAILRWIVVAIGLTVSIIYFTRP